MRCNGSWVRGAGSTRPTAAGSLAKVLGLGFTDVSAQYRGTQARSSSQSWLAWQLLVEQFQQGIIQAGLMTEQEVEEW